MIESTEYIENELRRHDLKRQMKQVGFCQAVEILGDGTKTGESITKKLKKPGASPTQHCEELKKHARKMKDYCSVLEQIVQEKINKKRRRLKLTILNQAHYEDYDNIDYG